MRDDDDDHGARSCHQFKDDKNIEPYVGRRL